MEKLDSKIWKVAAVVSLGPFMTQIDSTVVNVSLANIRDTLHATIASAQWIVSGYLLALALMLPLNGWLVDRIGAKRLYLICFSAFTLASVLCGAAHTMDQLIWARILQGAAGGILAPMTQLMVARVAGKQMARIIGYMGIPILIAPILGPVLAGAVLKYAGWPWLFYINLPVGCLALILAAILLPKDEESTQRRPFDFVGFMLISPGLACLLYGFESAAHGNGYSILIAGIVLLGSFVWHALKNHGKALVDLKLFKNHIFSTAATTQFLSNGFLYAGQLLVPLYLITILKLSATDAGWILTAMGIGMMCSFPMMGLLTDKFGCRAVSLTGAILAFLGTVPFLWMMEGPVSITFITLCIFVRGAGQGAIGVPSMSAAYSSVKKENLPTATTAINIVQRLGGPLATTILAIVMSVSAISAETVDPHAFLMAFVFLLVVGLLTIVSAIRLPVRVHQEK